MKTTKQLAAEYSANKKKLAGLQGKKGNLAILSSIIEDRQIQIVNELCCADCSLTQQFQPCEACLNYRRVK